MKMYCIDSTDCPTLKLDNQYECTTDGQYIWVNHHDIGKIKYNADRFNVKRKSDLIIENDLAEFRAKLNLKKGIETYETTNIQTCINESQMRIVRQPSEEQLCNRQQRSTFMSFLRKLFTIAGD